MTQTSSFIALWKSLNENLLGSAMPTTDTQSISQ